MSGLILHEDARSGNCYKIRLTAAHVGIELERRNYDIMKGETRTPEFLSNINGNGRIPVLQDGDRFLTESNAICFFLANGSKLIPDGHFDQAWSLCLPDGVAVRALCARSAQWRRTLRPRVRAVP